jgi:hypothetical protein
MIHYPIYLISIKIKDLEKEIEFFKSVPDQNLNEGSQSVGRIF